MGVNHMDPDGYERLFHLLERITPKIIATELSDEPEEKIRRKPFNEKETDSYFKKLGLKLDDVQKITVMEVENNMGSISGYEMRAIKDYIKKHPGCKLKHIDEYSICKKALKGREAMLDADTSVLLKDPEQSKIYLELLSQGTSAYMNNLRMGVLESYIGAEKEAEKATGIFNILSDPDVFEVFEKKLSPKGAESFRQTYNTKRDEIMSSRIRKLHEKSSGRIAVITGAKHSYIIGSKLKDLDPKILLLPDYNSL